VTYNLCLNAIEKEGAARDEDELYRGFVSKEGVEALDMPWLLETPAAIRRAALQDVLKAYKSAFARYERDKKPFTMHFRSRKTAFQESIVVPCQGWQSVNGVFSFIRRMRSSEALPADLGYDSRLLLAKPGRRSVQCHSTQGCGTCSTRSMPRARCTSWRRAT